MYANSKGLKYIHGCEVYLTEKLFWYPDDYDNNLNLLCESLLGTDPKEAQEEILNFEESQRFKKRDNYHTILIAKNQEGFKELNSLVSRSSQPDHFYYKPRISFEEFFNISDNIIKISACLASPLRRYAQSEGATRETFDRLLKAYDYYEIQPHVQSFDQKDFNVFLLEASRQYGKPLIVGTDTHSIDSYKAECRSILMEAKRIQFSNEDELDLTFKSYEELVEMFRQQGCLPMQIVLEAIENTNKMADQCEDFELDTSFKYPVLYKDEDRVFCDRIHRMYDEKLDTGVIPDDPRYLDNIQEELRVFRKIGMVGFMLFMSELVCWCKENGIPVGPGRGSVGGSTIAFITGITDIDPVKLNLVFSRFANEDRKEIGDIDIDISPSQRHLVYEHIIEKFGDKNTAYVLAIGTISDKGTIDEICRALNIPLDEVKKIKIRYSELTESIAANEEKLKEFDGRQLSDKETGVKNSLEKANNKLQKELSHFKNVEYKDVFYYFDGMVGTAISQSQHPAGIVVSPVTLPDNYGTFYADNKTILCINMEEIHEVSLVKYDILGLKNVEVIKDTCELAGIEYPRSNTVDWNDQDVWDHICDSPVGIFQFEGQFAFQSLKTFQCRSVADISLVTAAIRPSGATFRDKLLSHTRNHNPSKLIDDLLAENLGYLVYQEDTILFLKDICGLSGSDADNIRRAIGRKDKDRLEKALPDILEGYCSKSDKPREQSEEEAKTFIQIIEDSSRYQFGKNHSFAYSTITYLCAYLRYHYPKEFVTAYLNNANNDDDTLDGTQLAQQFKIPIRPIQFRHSLAKYSCDESGIYKGIESIKYLNAECANVLYSLKDRQYTDFVDLLADIDELPVDSRQLQILIELNFFSEFGGIEYLKQCNDVFKMFYGKKQVKKEQIFQMKVDFDQVRQCCQKETPKMFTGLDSIMLIRKIIAAMPVEKDSITKILAYQMDHLGYINIIDKKYAGYCVVIDIDVSYSPKITLYPLANGRQIVVKIPKAEYKKMPLMKGQIIHVYDDGYYKRPKMKYVDGEWVKDPSIMEWWVDRYGIIGEDNEIFSN